MLPEHIEKILKERYYLKNETSWEDGIAQRVSSIYPQIYSLIKDRIFIPSSPTLMNLNTMGERVGTLSSCFIMEIEDSICGIMDAMKEAAIVTKMAGGVGYNFSMLRGSNENVKSINANSGGVLSFIQIFDSVLEGVRQGGRRRGAGMSLLSVYHPDILKFIDAKIDRKKYARSNFSVIFDKSFYRVLNNTPEKIFRTINVVGGRENELLDDKGKPHTYKTLWDKIIHNAWESGEPGIFNGDIAVDRCTCKNISKNVFSNPCSEFVHIPYTSCNLGSLNLSKFLTEDNKFDWECFGRAVESSTYYLNAVIDNNTFPLDKIKKETLNSRPIGLGEMGLAHLFYKLEIPYDSDEAVKLAKDINRFMTLTSMRTSVNISKDKDKTYKYFDYDTFIDANKRFFDREDFKGIDIKQLERDIKKYGCYNSSQTSIAPTGTISYIADCSSGIEPVFGLVYTRKIEKENKIYESVYMVDPVFQEYIEKYYPTKKEKIYQCIVENRGSCQNCDELTKKERDIFVVAGDIKPEWHLRVLSAVANNVSLSVSKTINLPKDCSEKDIANVYLKAQEEGVIGVTVYRDGCREGILIHKDEEIPEHVQRQHAPKRPKDLECDIHQMNVVSGGVKERFVTLVGKLSGTVYEIFVTKDLKNRLDFNRHQKGIIRKINKGRYDLIIKEGGEDIAYIEDLSSVFGGPLGTLSRLSSMSLRHGTPLQIVVEQLSKDKFSAFQEFDKCVARVLKHYISEGETVVTSEVCPECGSKLAYIEGCKSCSAKCGWAKCS